MPEQAFLPLPLRLRRGSRPSRPYPRPTLARSQIPWRRSRVRFAPTDSRPTAAPRHRCQAPFPKVDVDPGQRRVDYQEVQLRHKQTGEPRQDRPAPRLPTSSVSGSRMDGAASRGSCNGCATSGRAASALVAAGRRSSGNDVAEGPVILLDFKHVAGNVLRSRPHPLLQHLNDRGIKDPFLVEGAVLVESELHRNGF